MEGNLTSFHPAMSWRSVVAGLLITLFSFVLFLSLGIGFGGVSLGTGASLKASGIASAAWIILSVAISLFIGGYFVARFSNFMSNRVGMGQGLVLTALFFGFTLWQAGAIMGSVANMMGSMVVGTARVIAPASDMAMSSPMVDTIIDDQLGDLEIRGDRQDVMAGITSRLIRGDEESAKRYLARHSNLSLADINTRIDQLNLKIHQAIDEARVQAANALKISGWSMFAMLVIGLIAAVLGGRLGATYNQRDPLAVPMSTVPTGGHAFV